jgi:hypothetical protein
MTRKNKIYLQVLVQLLRWENLICSFKWMLSSAGSGVYSSGWFWVEVRKDLASEYIFSDNSYNQPNWDVLKYKLRLRSVSFGELSQAMEANYWFCCKYFWTQRLFRLVGSIKMVYSHLTQIIVYPTAVVAGASGA